MQNLVTFIKSKAFLALFVSLSTLSLQAVSVDMASQDIYEAQEELALLIDSMDTAEKIQFVKTLEEAVNASQPQQNTFLQRIGKVLWKVPYARLSAACLRLAIAIAFWESLPTIKENYPNSEFTVELSKVLAGSLVIDGFKDFLKSLKEMVEADIVELYSACSSKYATLVE